MNWWRRGGRFAELARAQFMVQENAQRAFMEDSKEPPRVKK
jgi:hypothetical protein